MESTLINPGHTCTTLYAGEMLAGALEGDDVLLVPLVQNLDCVAASLAYRLAPEYPAPIGAYDCYRGLR